MNTVYLIHGWGGSPTSEPWFDWLSKSCSEQGLTLVAPKMPDSDRPVIASWLNKLKEIVEDKSCYFVGHSIGCQAILRFLEKAPFSAQGIVLVAPWMKLDAQTLEEEELAIAKPWVETPINFKVIRKKTKKVLCIFSDNDPYVSLDEAQILKKELSAKIVIKKHEKHFNKTLKIPEIVSFIAEDVQ